MRANVDRGVLALIVVVILIGFFLPSTGCREGLPPEPSVVVIVSSDDGGAYDEPFDAPSGYAMPRCARACANLQRRGCLDGYTRPGEDSCYVVCRRAESSGRIDLKTACVAVAVDREAVRACGTYRCL